MAWNCHGIISKNSPATGCATGESRHDGDCIESPEFCTLSGKLTWLAMKYPHFQKGNTSLIRVHFPASYLSLPGCKYHGAVDRNQPDLV